MNNKKNLLILGVVLLLVVVMLVLWMKQTPATMPVEEPVVEEENNEEEVVNLDEEWVNDHLPGIAAEADRIVLESIQPGDVIESPLVVSGEARGPWYFEADFPVYLNDWNGLTIATGIAVAEGEWMTEDFVPFTVTMTFTNPYNVGDPDFMKKGTLILQRNNPSDLPENDAAIEVPVFFAN